MKFSFSLIFSLAVFATARKCGTPEPSQEHLEASQTFAQEAVNVENSRQATEAAPITISVWFHVLRAGTLVSQGNIPDSQITAQVRDLRVCPNLPPGIHLLLTGCGFNSSTS